MTNFKAQMSNEVQMQNVEMSKKRRYDLEERTALFGEKIIEFSMALPDRASIKIVLNQLIRSATSIGANYMEADCALSRRDFAYKISLCKKESKESLHWLRMLAKAHTPSINICRSLWREAHELCLIFSSIL